MRYDAQVSHRAPVLVMETVLQISSEFFFTFRYLSIFSVYPRVLHSNTCSLCFTYFVFNLSNTDATNLPINSLFPSLQSLRLWRYGLRITKSKPAQRCF